MYKLNIAIFNDTYHAKLQSSNMAKEIKRGIFGISLFDILDEEGNIEYADCELNSK